MADAPSSDTAPKTSALKKATLASMLASPRGLVRFLRDREAPWSSKILSVVTLAYVVSPVDVIPDWLVPVLGWCDDIGVTGLALAFVASQAAKYANEHPGIAVRSAEGGAPPKREE